MLETIPRFDDSDAPIASKFSNAEPSWYPCIYSCREPRSQPDARAIGVRPNWKIGNADGTRQPFRLLIYNTTPAAARDGLV
jgi:hypothetical protein